MSERAVSRRTVLGASAAGLIGLAGLGGCSTIARLGPVPDESVGGCVSPEQAARICVTVLGAVADARAKPGPDGDPARARAFTGDALTAASADARLNPTVTDQERATRIMTSADPTVLAVSRSTNYPRQIIAQTIVASTGLPVLHLLVAPDVRTPYKVAASSTMLAGASVRAFDPVTAGSLPVAGATNLSVQPTELLVAYAKSVSVPVIAGTGAAPFTDDAWASAVRKLQQKQSDDLHGAVNYTVDQQPKNVVGGLTSAGGDGALVFAVLERTDEFVNKTTVPFTPPAAFTALTGKPDVKAEAIVKTLEFLAFAIPPSGPATLVAGDRSIYAAQGT